MNHPLHPLVVHLPVGLWVAALLVDIGYLATGNATLPPVSYYCILIGLIGAAIAVPLGLAEYLEIPANTLVKRIATTHMVMNLAIAGLFLFNLWLRYRMEGSVPSTISASQMILTLLSVGLLGGSGYLGGLLVYQYGIGHQPRLRDRLDRVSERGSDDRAA